MFVNGTRVIVILVILAALLGFLPVPAHAQDEIDLVLGGAGSTAWDIQGIAPGSSGTKTVSLTNDGSLDGQVTIWVSDIVSTEGANPESETGDTSEPGELINYILLSCSATGLTTNIALPVTIDNLPQNAADANYIRLPLNASASVTLTWDWEFEETGQPQNDAYGDGLSFSINYYLEDVSSNPPVVEDEPVVVCYYVPTNYQQLDFNVMGNEASASIDSSGRLISSLTVTDPDKLVELALEEGTIIASSGGDKINKIEVIAVGNPALVAEGTQMIGEVYEIIGYTEDSIMSSIVFKKPIVLNIAYHSDWLPEDVSSLYVATLDSNGNWQRYEGYQYSSRPDELSVVITHSAVFTILAGLKLGSEVTGGIVPVISDHGESMPPHQPAAVDVEGSTAADTQNTAKLYPPYPRRSFTISNADIIERWQRVSLSVMIAGSAALMVLGIIERRRNAYNRYHHA
jgi:hypothetical protein